MAIILLLVSPFSLQSQPSMGMTGLLNSPSAVMTKEGTVKAGGNFLNTNMTPDQWDYNTFNFFINITFFDFLEAALTNTAFSFQKDGKFNNIDRAVCVKFQPLKEGRYHPSVAIISNDLLTSNTTSYFDPTRGNKYFGTHYIAMSKHFNLGRNTIGIHTAYNILSSTKQTINFPFSGGISLSPFFYKKMSIIAEYDTRNFNLGGNILLFDHLFLQAFIQDLKYISFGAHLRFSLL